MNTELYLRGKVAEDMLGTEMGLLIFLPSPFV